MIFTHTHIFFTGMCLWIGQIQCKRKEKNIERIQRKQDNAHENVQREAEQEIPVNAKWRGECGLKSIVSPSPCRFQWPQERKRYETHQQEAERNRYGKWLALLLLPLFSVYTSCVHQQEGIKQTDQLFAHTIYFVQSRTLVCIVLHFAHIFIFNENTISKYPSQTEFNEIYPIY